MIVSQQLKHIELLINQRELVVAEQLCLTLQQDHPKHRHLLQLLAHIYLQTSRTELAIDALNECFLLDSSNRKICDYLANLYGQIKDFKKASWCYRQYLQHTPNDADALYNYAFNLRHAGEFEASVLNYKLALDAKITQPEEVMLNMAVIYSDHLRNENEAKNMLQAALHINPSYVPAIFNLANLYEQAGDKNNADRQFKKILNIQPDHYEALARLADLQTFSKVSDPLIVRMQEVLSSEVLNLSSKIDLMYALGKALNDCGAYTQAFECYQHANQLNSREQTPYQPTVFAAQVERIKQYFSMEWFSSRHSDSDYQPVFICGMFRSGSTLIEQILAGHASIKPGGELEFFVRKVANEISPFPEKMQTLTQQYSNEIAQEYIAYITQRFSEQGLVTDKRADNFLYVGLILSLFPNAKIIFTERHPLDNCLSVYFQRLGQSMNYATDLSHISHYYTQQKELMMHWKNLFPASVFICNYDDLVREPEANIRSLLTFLGLEWSTDCLNFYRLDNNVKTASVWQVRQPLYSSSSGRWHNFKSNIPDLIKFFDV
ncbi:tetratricopeptide repeat-containing sulfotransferase family protein [Paraglaciecola hydrolytica]|uniref:Uncharacterized protein n=1 Tax=Paraglaciecola hydrolytica TaxID=1799789 RepID=A0A148KNU9_9ALTE|nr:sulfotransferase family protein [Paraglaciecola hydrolytica]KXI27982.1 hypothetical protein AX660_21025 [Paraglaciecola hydrolytica]